MRKSLTQFIIAMALLTGGFLFVCDVVSPHTPTPNVQLVAKSFVDPIADALLGLPFVDVRGSNPPERLLEAGAEQVRNSRACVLTFVCSLLL